MIFDVTDDWFVKYILFEIMDLYSRRTLEMIKRKIILQCSVTLLYNIIKYINS